MGLRTAFVQILGATVFFATPALPRVGHCGQLQGGAINLLTDPGFEKAPGTTGAWQAYGQGYERDTAVKRSGASSAHCASTSADEQRGAALTVVLDQKQPSPISVAGWSKAMNAVGATPSDYSIYVDLVYTDGTPLWGQIAPFLDGTHDWERRQVRIFPNKPVRQLTIYAMFRNHSGEAWFDDFEAYVYPAQSLFDGQLVDPPRLVGSTPSGWFVRDVAKESQVTQNLESLGVRIEVSKATDGVQDATVFDTTGKPRAITVYYVERFSSSDTAWWDDVRTKRSVAEKGEFGNLAHADGLGAVGALSLYPFGCVTGGGRGLVLGAAPLQGPRVMRVGYNASAKLLFIAFDVALVPDSIFNGDGRGHGSAKVTVYRTEVAADWGFRAAASAFYRRFPEAFDKRVKQEGIWMPFTDPASIPGVEDFGVSFHEGDGNLVTDDKLGILSFRYTEPMSWWMPMAPSAPRTYEAALQLAKDALTGDDLDKRAHAQALFNSGTVAADGRFNVEFRNEPWTNGAVWALNPNPRLPHPADEATKATLNYTKEMGDTLYPGPVQNGDAGRDGEYLDSIEGWADVQDYRPEALKYSLAPPTFNTDTRRPVVPLWFSTCEMAAFMRDDLRRRGRLLMANATPWRFHAFLPLLDVAGTEVNWAKAPDSDAVFNLRRTLSYRKPYLLLQNTDFSAFGVDRVEAYLRRCMFYAVYPSMFSADASTHVYWENPTLYNAGRPLFKHYIPLIKSLSLAGWEPITYARTGDPKLYVERYGKQYLTLLNDSPRKITCSLSIDVRRILGVSQDKTDVVDVETDKLVGRIIGDSGHIDVDVAPYGSVILRLKAVSQ